MGKGAIKGSIRDYYKLRGQRTHGMTGRRQKLSPTGQEKRKQRKAARRAARRAGGNPSQG